MRAGPWPAALLLGALVALAACSRDEDLGPPPEPAPPGRAPQALELRVTGDDFRWRIRYPGPDGDLDTPDDVVTWRHLHLPADSEIVIDLRSADYVYTFYVPHLDIMEAAVPDAPFVLDFESGKPARDDLLGSQMCGYTHPELLGDLVIHPPADFELWLAGLGG